MGKSAKMKLSKAIELSIPQVEQGRWGDTSVCLVCAVVHHRKYGCQRCPVNELLTRLYPDRGSYSTGCVHFCERLDTGYGHRKNEREEAHEQLRLLIAKLRREGK